MGRISADVQPIVNRMTNWQRNQWAKAGYPVEPRSLMRYSRMKKPEYRMRVRSKQSRTRSKGK
jgi:hypothetical protein